MTSFYEDEDKITFDEAEQLAERFIREHGDRVNRVTSKDVAGKYDVEKTRHNLVRINQALDERLEVMRSASSRATQFKLDHGTADR
jgi:hypothetical protein